jgi:photosystem II stability/assembly factor-like uncharacterized protein
MGKLSVGIILGFAVAAGAASPPSEVVVFSPRLASPETGGEWSYLGRAADGYLYRGPEEALAAVAPYRLLDRAAARKDYYLVWLPEGSALTAAHFAPLGTSVRLAEREILVGLAAGVPPAALRAVDRRLEIARVTPTRPPAWRYAGETPPAKKNARVAAALEAITAESYASYIRTLQDFKSRYTDSPGFDGARQYMYNFFGLQNFTPSYFPFKFGTFRRLHYPDAAGYLYVEASSDTIKKSRDYGRTWTSLAAGDVNTVGVSCWLDRDTGVVGGLEGLLARTTDGGRSWTTTRIGPKTNLTYRALAVGFASAEVGWVAGPVYRGQTPQGEFFFKTADGGRTWQAQTVPANFPVRWLAVASASHAWAGGDGGVVYTSDGGARWRRSQTPATLWNFAAAGPALAWATDSAGRLYRTTNGIDWVRRDPGLPGSLWQVDFADASHGFAYGDKFVRTADGGASWEELPKPPLGTCNVLAFADGDHGVVGSTFEQKLYRTDDGGRTFVDLGPFLDVYAENVIGERRGTERPKEIVLIGGHFDCTSEKPVTDAPGAEDNASGTACALAAAAAFKNLSFKRTVRCVAFGGEEEGILGSTAYVEDCLRRGEKVIAFLNADMVAFDEENGLRDDYGLAYGEYKWLYDYARQVGSLYGSDIIYDRFEYRGSDHKPFWDRGLAFAVYPNPYGYASAGGGVHFVGLRAPATIDVYDLSGRRLVREEVAAGGSVFVWRPTAAAVAPGVYLYAVSGANQEEAGKIVIVK